MARTIELATVQGDDGQLHQGEVVHREYESRFDPVLTLVTGGVGALSALATPNVKETTVRSGDSYHYGKEVSSRTISLDD